MGSIILVIIIDYGSAFVLFSRLLISGQMGKVSGEVGGGVGGGGGLGKEVMKFFESAVFVASIHQM